MVRPIVSLSGLCFLWLILINPVDASDHLDRPKVGQDRRFDITGVFAFPSPERPGRLVLIMNTLPEAGDPEPQFSKKPAPAESEWFYDRLDYSFVVRRASVGRTGSDAEFAVDHKEFRFSCSFRAHKDDSQRGTCKGPAGISVPVEVNDQDGNQAQGLRVFAGLRSDPFFLDLANLGQTLALPRITELENKIGADALLGPITGSKNSLHGKDVLSIVIEADIDKLFGPGGGSLFAVVGEVHISGEEPVRVDRQRRSEMTNITLGRRQSDEVNPNLEIRAWYNQEDSFDMSAGHAEVYGARYNANLEFWDKLDGKIDWPLDNGQHPLTKLFLNDFLIVDTSKLCKGNTFLEIERSVRKKQPHATCGGRTLDEDTVDTLLTLYIRGDTGERIGDGVDRATQSADTTFPYLAAPNRSATNGR